MTDDQWKKGRKVWDPPSSPVVIPESYLLVLISHLSFLASCFLILVSNLSFIASHISRLISQI